MSVKKIFAAASVLFCFSVLSFSADVSTESQLLDFMMLNSSGIISINTPITITNSLPLRSNKNFTIETSSMSSIFLSGGLQYGGFKFSASTISFSGAFELRNFVSTSSGAVLYAYNSNLLFSGVSFSNNASLAGGAVYITGSQISVSNVNVSGNESVNAAGGFYIDKSAAEISESTFFNNLSNGPAGAIYLSNSSLVLNQTSFNSNLSFEDGGALYIENSTVTINGGSFINNEAAQNGGAIYIKSSQLNLNGSVVFDANAAGAVPNDIYLDKDAKLFLDSQGKDIIFNGGINSNLSEPGIEITKTGNGNVIFGGDTLLNASVDVLKGSLVVSQNVSFKANEANIASGAALSLNAGTIVNISTLTVNSNAALKTENISSFNSAQLNMSGVLKIGVDTAHGTSDLINAQTLNLNSASSTLEFAGNLSQSSASYTIIQASNITGTFKETSGSYGARANWSIIQNTNDIKLNLVVKGYSDIFNKFEGNQLGVIKTIDAVYYDSFNKYNDLWHNVISPMDAMDIKDLQKTASALAGSIYAELFSIGSLNRSKDSLFEQISVRTDNNNSWALAKGDMFSLKQDLNSNGDLKDTSFGLMGGSDFYGNKENLAAGALLEYNYHSIEQNEDDAKIYEINGGFYGDALWQYLELKGFLTVGLSQYEVTRKIVPLSQTAEGEFTSYNAKVSLQAAGIIRLGQFVSLRPFIGADGVFLRTSSFDENGTGAQLHFEEQDFMTSTFGGGLGLKGEVGIFSWFINGGADFVINSSEDKVETSFVQAKGTVFEILPTKRGDTAVKASAGFEVKLEHNSVIFVNAGYVSSDNYDDIRANIGFKYRLDYGF